MIATAPKEHAGRTYRLTGPSLITYTDIAEELSAVLGHPVEHRQISPGEHRATMIAAGIPEAVATSNAQAFGLIAEGDAAWLSDDVNGILLDLHNNRGAVGYGIEAFTDRNPLAWPSFATVDDVTGFPPTVISVNECDPLRDEGINFYRLLLRAGVQARGRQVLGTMHGTRSSSSPARKSAATPRATWPPSPETKEPVMADLTDYADVDLPAQQVRDVIGDFAAISKWRTSSRNRPPRTRPRDASAP